MALRSSLSAAPLRLRLPLLLLVLAASTMLIAASAAPMYTEQALKKYCSPIPGRPWKGVSCLPLNCGSRCATPITYETTPFNSYGKASFGSAEYVLIIGVDGMGGWYLDPLRLPTNVSIPNLDFLRNNGAWTYYARQVMPTVSKPNWASIVMGAGPEEHGILDNGWVVGTQMPPITGANTYFPSMFQAVRDQAAGNITTAFYNDWAGFFDVFPTDVFDYSLLTQDPDSVYVSNRLIQDIISQRKANLMMVHFDDVDEAGHGHGWGTPEYYRAIMGVDVAIGNLLGALERAGILDKTLVMVTADHGGEQTGHGETDEFNMYTPFIMSGPGVASNYEIPCPTRHLRCFDKNAKNPRNVRALDIAPTALYALGLKAPQLWIGRPIVEAYLDNLQ